MNKNQNKMILFTITITFAAKLFATKLSKMSIKNSQEIPGTGIKKHNKTIKEKYLANMWREKEFWPKHSQPHPPLFLIIPRLLVVVTATINEQKSKQNDLIHYN